MAKKHIVDAAKSFGMPRHLARAMCGVRFAYDRSTSGVCEKCQIIDAKLWKELWGKVWSGNRSLIR